MILNLNELQRNGIQLKVQIENATVLWFGQNIFRTKINSEMAVKSTLSFYYSNNILSTSFTDNSFTEYDYWTRTSYYATREKRYIKNNNLTNFILGSALGGKLLNQKKQFK